MRWLSNTLLLSLLLAAQACTKQAVYDNVRTDSRWDCGKLPLSQQKECREQSAITYQEYERERQALLKSESPSPDR